MASGVFLLRGFNDIDYVVPILDRLLRDRPFEMRAFFVDPFYDERGDTRLEHLRSRYGFTVEWLYEDAAGTATALFRLIRAFVRSPLRRTSVGRRVNALLTMLWGRYFDRVDVARLVDRLAGSSAIRFVAIDHVANRLIERVVRELRTRGAKCVMVPGGTVMITNMMWHPTHVSRADARPGKPPQFADVILFGTANERDRHDLRALPEHHVIGIPRYCDEWMRISQTIRESNASGFLNTGRRDLNRRIGDGFDRASRYPARLKIVYMATFPDAGLWVDEMVRTVRLICDFDDVVVVTKFKPTNQTPRMTELFAALMERPNSFVVAGNVSSSALINWADVVLINVSSIALEAIQRRKPVWCLEYLQSVESVFARFNVGLRLRTRDDVVHAVETMLARGPGWSDPAGDVERFKREFIHASLPDGDVLGAAARILGVLADPTRSRTAPLEHQPA